MCPCVDGKFYLLFERELDLCLQHSAIDSWIGLYLQLHQSIYHKDWLEKCKAFNLSLYFKFPQPPSYQDCLLSYSVGMAKLTRHFAFSQKVYSLVKSPLFEVLSIGIQSY